MSTREHEALMKAAEEAREGMIRMGLALRPALEAVVTIAKQPAFQRLATEAERINRLDNSPIPPLPRQDSRIWRAVRRRTGRFVQAQRKGGTRPV